MRLTFAILVASTLVAIIISMMHCLSVFIVLAFMLANLDVLGYPLTNELMMLYPEVLLYVRMGHSLELVDDDLGLAHLDHDVDDCLLECDGVRVHVMPSLSY